MPAGKRGKEMLADVVRVLGSFRQCEPASHEEPMPPFQLHNCQYGGAQQSRLLPDATITVGTEQFHVHRNVLADQSTYFHRLFSSCMKEGAPDPCRVCAPLVHKLWFFIQNSLHSFHIAHCEICSQCVAIVLDCHVAFLLGSKHLSNSLESLSKGQTCIQTLVCIAIP